MEKIEKEYIGTAAQKVLLLLSTGVALAFAGHPSRQLRVLREVKKEWEDINRKSLRRAIRRLYESKLADYKENDDGTVSVVLNNEGKKIALRYNLDSITIKKPNRWDGLWRIVIFDIPEDLKQGRDALAEKLKQLGFCPIQKSVFVFPYECRSEVDFVVEVFNLRPYVRLIIAKEIDIDFELRPKFRLRT